MKQVQKINFIGLLIYIVFAAFAVFCILSPIFCIMPKFYAICVMLSGAFTILGMFFNRRVLWDTVKYTLEIPEEGDEEPKQEVPVVEEKPKKTSKKKGGK